jgi:hypothetical protein
MLEFKHCYVIVFQVAPPSLTPLAFAGGVVAEHQAGGHARA